MNLFGVFVVYIQVCFLVQKFRGWWRRRRRHIRNVWECHFLLSNSTCAVDFTVELSRFQCKYNFDPIIKHLRIYCTCFSVPEMFECVLPSSERQATVTTLCLYTHLRNFSSLASCFAQEKTHKLTQSTKLGNSRIASLLSWLAQLGITCMRHTRIDSYPLSHLRIISRKTWRITLISHYTLSFSHSQSL